MAASQWIFDQRSVFDLPKFQTLEPLVYAASASMPTATGLSEAQHTTSSREATVLSQPVIEATPKNELRPFPLLASIYSIPNPIAVETFLRRNRFLLNLLFSAFPKIKAIVGADAEIGLVDDPDGGFSVLVVRLSSQRPDAFEALDRFDEDWWLDHIKDARGLLNFVLQDDI